MKKINVRSPYYIVADNVIPPADTPNQTGTYYIINLITHINGIALPTGATTAVRDSLKDYICQPCNYTWEDSVQGGVRMIGMDKEACPDGTPCYEYKTQVTYKALKVPMLNTEQLYTNADSPAAASITAGYYVSNTIEQYTTFDKGKDPDACILRTGDEESKFTFYKIYKFSSSGVIEEVITPNLSCPGTGGDSEAVDIIKDPSLTVKCDKEYNIGPYIGRYTFTLSTPSVNTDSSKLEIKITGSPTKSLKPVLFKAWWVAETSLGGGEPMPTSRTSSADGGDYTTGYLGDITYEDALKNLGVSSAMYYLGTAGSPSKGQTTANAQTTIEVNKTGVDGYVKITADAPLGNDEYTLTISCPKAGEDVVSDGSYWGHIASRTRINLVAGWDGTFSDILTETNEAPYTASSSILAQAYRLLETEWVTAGVYADVTSFRTWVQIKRPVDALSLIGYGSTGNDPRTCNFGFLNELQTYMNACCIGTGGVYPGGDTKTIALIFVGSSEGHYYDQGGTCSAEFLRYKYISSSNENPSILGRHLHFVQTKIGNAPYGTYSAYIINTPLKNTVSDDSYIEQSMQLIKQGYISNINNPECNGFYLSNIPWSCTDPSRRYGGCVEPEVQFNTDSLEYNYNDPTRSAPLIKYDWGRNVWRGDASGNPAMTPTALKEKIVDYIKALGHTKADGSELPGGS